MRTLITAIIFSFVTATFSVGARAQLLTAGRCMTDDDVPENERDPYEKSAMQFVETLIGEKPEEAYSDLVDELHGKLSADDFVRGVNQIVRPFPAFRGFAHRTQLS